MGTWEVGCRRDQTSIHFFCNVLILFCIFQGLMIMCRLFSTYASGRLAGGPVSSLLSCCG